MNFENFVASVSEGELITHDGQDYTVLQVNKGLVILRPLGTSIYYGLLSASVRVVCVTKQTFDSFYSNHG